MYVFYILEETNMLINCMECGNNVSDKAMSCPHCGYPLHVSRMIKFDEKKRLPNGFGQISKIKNRNLRKPYRALVTMKDEKGNSKVKPLRPISYFSTYKEAYEALLENSKSPYEKLKESTFLEVYEKWFDEKKNTISSSRQETYVATIKHLRAIWNMKMIDIKSIHLKEVLSSITSTSTEKNAKILLNQVFDYAIENEIVDKNYARIIKVNDDLNLVKHPHRSLKEEEIKILLCHSNDLISEMLLMQCYTGMRPGELVSIQIENVHLNERYIIGGKKTKAGINRVIPIHDFIFPLFEKHYQLAKQYQSKFLLMNKHHQPMTYRNYQFHFCEFCKENHIEDCRLHDCRKYFVTIAKRYKVDEYAIKRIVGHAIRDITESVYTERSLAWLLEEINKIPSPIKCV